MAVEVEMEVHVEVEMEVQVVVQVVVQFPPVVDVLVADVLDQRGVHGVYPGLQLVLRHPAQILV